MSNLGNIVGTRLNVATAVSYKFRLINISAVWVALFLCFKDDAESEALSYYQDLLTLQGVDEDSPEWDYDYNTIKSLYDY